MNALKVGVLTAIFSVFLLSPLWAADGVHVSAVSGGVSLGQAGHVAQALVGVPMNGMDILRTESDGQVDVTLNGLAGFRLLGNTECVLVSQAVGAMAIRVTKGNVILNLKELPAGTSFSMETPTVIAAVRGTQFWGRVDSAAGSPVSTIAVRQGRVSLTVKASGEVISLLEGQALDVPKGDATPERRPALEAELEAMRQADYIAIWA